MKSEILVLSIATASPIAMHMLKVERVRSSEGMLKVERVRSSEGIVVTSHLQQLSAAAAADLSMLINAPQPAGRSLDAIAKLKDLVPGWDGADAPPPSRLAMENAQLVVESLEARGVSRVKIAPDVDGGVVVTVVSRVRGHYVAIACDNEGDAHLIIEAPPHLPKVSPVAIDEAATAMIDFAAA